jgi:Flp pilus assembly protein TadD
LHLDTVPLLVAGGRGAVPGPLVGRMPDKMLDNSELHLRKCEEAGLLAYKNGDFAAAIAYLLEVTDRKRENWRAKLYLAMAFFQIGGERLALSQFRYLSACCPDTGIQLSARAAMHYISPRGARQDAASEPLKDTQGVADGPADKKAALVPPRLDEALPADIVWVDRGVTLRD